MKLKNSVLLDVMGRSYTDAKGIVYKITKNMYDKYKNKVKVWQAPLKFEKGWRMPCHVYDWCNYLSTLGFKLTHVSKRGP